MKVKKIGSLWEPSLFFAPKISEKDGGTKDKKTWGMDGCPKAVWLPNDDYYGHIGRDGMGVT